MTETIEVTLRSGVVVNLTIDGDLLSLTSEEFDILRVLAASIRSFVEPERTELQRRALNGSSRPTPRHIGARPARQPRAKVNGSPIDFDDVAKEYIAAASAGRPVIQALCDRFGVEHSVAKNWPNKCRALGLLPPLGQPVVHTEAPHQFVSHGREPLQ